VLVSAPVAAFSQVNEAQLYVSMSRARHSALSLLSHAVTNAIGIDLQRRAAMQQAQRGVDMARGWER